MTYKAAAAVILGAVWISANEFLRNQLLLLPQWVAHYRGLGLEFPAAPSNGAVWGLWSLVFAAALYGMLRVATFFQTVVLSWMFGFVLMWLVIGNLGVLPFSILPYAVPWSILECAGAAWIIRRVADQSA